MSSLALDLDRVLCKVDPETASQLERAVRDAISVAQQRSSRTQATDPMGYPAGYFESTAGSFANEPLDIPSEPPMQIRESW